MLNQNLLEQKMPRFSGSNVDGWVFKAKKYLRYHEIQKRIIVATFNMEGEAL